MTLADTAREPRLDYAMRTDAGRKREVNEDAALAAFPCFLVADGMGGHEAGDLASRAAIAEFERRIRPGVRSTVAEVGAALEAARVAVEAVAAGRERGAGCTLAGAVLVEEDGELLWLILNVGDSRVYLHRGAELQQVTIDHSLQNEALAEGGAGEALPSRNIITRALGAADSTADTWMLPVETGSRLLICSDGLTTEVADEEIRATLTMGGRPEAVVDELVNRANRAGGRDNVTVVVVDTAAGGTAWHIAPERGGETLDDDTVTATVPRRRRT
ncbi:serine/threonine-protein phosphatase [Leucobacter zeae]|nr:serine/threonine-protein phosphatase [Leucobacter zeae]